MKLASNGYAQVPDKRGGCWKLVSMSGRTYQALRWRRDSLGVCVKSRNERTKQNVSTTAVENWAATKVLTRNVELRGGPRWWPDAPVGNKLTVLQGRVAQKLWHRSTSHWVGHRTTARPKPGSLEKRPLQRIQHQSRREPSL